MRKIRKISKNPKETAKIAEVFLKKILKAEDSSKGATVVCLSGDLGAGKTAFTQSAAKHLGIKNKIASPTFVIFKKYPIPDATRRYGASPLENNKYKLLFHVDAYRLKNEKELLHLGWEEIIGNKENLIFIEWPENVRGIIPAGASFVYIAHGGEKKRIFELK